MTDLQITQQFLLTMGIPHGIERALERDSARRIVAGFSREIVTVFFFDKDEKLQDTDSGPREHFDTAVQQWTTH